MIPILIELLLWLCLVVLIHEVGHISTILLTRAGRIKKVGISKKGFFCHWVPYSTNWNLFAFIALAGPLFNLLAAAVIQQLQPTFSFYNLLFGALNLVLPGGDGWSAVKRLKQKRSAVLVTLPIYMASRFPKH